MASVLGKVRTLILSTAHSLLDRAIDLNSVGALEVYIRDLENAKDEIQTAASEARADLSIVSGQVTSLQKKKSQDEEHIELLLDDGDPSNDNLAVTIQERVLGYDNEMTTLNTQLVAARTLCNGLDTATQRIIKRHAEMLKSLNGLRAKERGAKASEKAADALKNAGQLASTGADVSVDNVTARIDRRAAVANERLNTAMGDLAATTAESDTIDQVKAKKMIADRIAQRAAKQPTISSTEK